ncbi:NmrA family transcriptional regulator [Reticulibacter mediterranei]|uniref:NmrA family transcriptional regulator n=1 Tax=Reticulibacter mediterranei TaxID=2778369 RepID=A0A8J3J1F0_9CHLR|nr:NmrA/HSCARG family protein [Reticulibacter mediterranei]GHP00531.1 NmrA family transcriptional regulator [Reticulibacter mediterranei]
MPHTDKTILVFGATGQQGSAVARQLLKDDWNVRALVRDPRRAQSEALRQQGVELVQGDLNQPSSLREAMKDVYGIFSVQTPYAEGGAAAELQQGKAVADAALQAGVSHLVYSSVGGAERGTGIAHFESKWQIEEYLRALHLPVTILRPVFFMSNLQYATTVEADGTLVVSQALRPETRLQMIAVEDIGKFAALAFAHPESFLGKEIEIAGEELTIAEIAESIERVTGKPTRFVELPLEQLRSFDAETAMMYEWFNQSGYQAAIPALRQLHPDLLTLEAWLKQSGMLSPSA